MLKRVYEPAKCVCWRPWMNRPLKKTDQHKRSKICQRTVPASSNQVGQVYCHTACTENNFRAHHQSKHLYGRSRMNSAHPLLSTDRPTDQQNDRPADRQMDRPTDGQRHRQTNSQASRQRHVISQYDFFLCVYFCMSGRQMCRCQAPMHVR